MGGHNKAIRAPKEEFKAGSVVDPRIHPRVVIALRGQNEVPIVLDVFGNPEIEVEDAPSGARYAYPSDTDQANAIDDVVFANGGNKLALNADGNAVMACASTLFVSLGPGGLQIVKGGDTSEQIAVSGATVMYLNTLISRVNSLQAALFELDAYLKSRIDELAAHVTELWAAVAPVPVPPPLTVPVLPYTTPDVVATVTDLEPLDRADIVTLSATGITVPYTGED